MTAAASERSVVRKAHASVVLFFNWALCHEHPDLIGSLLARLSTACLLWILYAHMAYALLQCAFRLS